MGRLEVVSRKSWRPLGRSRIHQKGFLRRQEPEKVQTQTSSKKQSGIIDSALFWLLWWALWAVLRPSWAHVEPSRGHLTPSRARLGASWTYWSPFGTVLEAILGHLSRLGGHLNRPGALLGPSWGPLGPLWGILAGIWATLGAISGFFWAASGRWKAEEEQLPDFSKHLRKIYYFRLFCLPEDLLEAFRATLKASGGPLGPSCGHLGP